MLVKTVSNCTFWKCSKSSCLCYSCYLQAESSTKWSVVTEMQLEGRQNVLVLQFIQQGFYSFLTSMKLKHSLEDNYPRNECHNQWLKLYAKRHNKINILKPQIFLLFRQSCTLHYTCNNIVESMSVMTFSALSSKAES